MDYIMANTIKKVDLFERRRPSESNFDDLWEDLTLAQKFAASNLTQFGYRLLFIRDYYNSHLAVLSSKDSLVTISKSGEINTQPTITIRQ
jgi:hypothetical protein